MLVHATKEHAEREDEESERLVRESPKLKPPRRDKRREGIRPDSDPDVDGDPDLKSKDKSLNYKQVGGSVASNVVRLYFQRAASIEEKIPVKKKDTGQTVLISPDTLREKPGEYEEIKDEEEGLPSQQEPSQAEGEVPPESPKKPKKPTQKKEVPAEGKAPSKEGPQEGSNKDPTTEDGSGEDSKENTEEGEKGKKPKKPKPTVAEQHGITPPQRREPSIAERAEANYALAETLPPDVAAKLIASRIHPDDAKQLVESYQAAQARRIDGNVGAFASKLKGFYETDPDKIQPPVKWKTADGKRVDFESLSPDEKANAYRQHQMQVLAVSLASKDAISKKLAGDKGDVDPKFVSALTDSLLGRAKVNPQRVFDAATKGKGPPISNASAKRLLSAVKGNPETTDVVQKYLEASNYREAKSKFLGEQGFSEKDSPSLIVGGLLDSRKFFAAKAKDYGLEASDGTGAKHFETQVLSKLKELDPKKHKQVQATLTAVAAADYDRAKKAYDRDMQRWTRTQKGPQPKEPVKPFGYGTTQGKQSLRSEGQRLWEDLVGRSGAKKQAASVALRHLISSYLLDSSMAPRSSQTKEALYHGIDPAENYASQPYPGWQQAQQRDFDASDVEIILSAATEWLKSPVLTQGYEEASISDPRYRHALDLAIQASPYNHQIDATTYNVLLAKLQGVPEPGFSQPGLPTKAAKTKSRSDLERAIYAKLPTDSKRRKGSDLVVMLDELLAEKLHKEAFSTLIIQDLSESELQTLASALKVKVASYAYASETMSLLFYGKGVFNRDVVNDLYYMPFVFRDAQGDVHDDVGMRVTETTYGPIVTRIDEEKGFTREILVNVRIPKGSKSDAFKAARIVAARHKLKVELAAPGVKPGMRQSEKAKVRRMPGLRGLRASSFAIADASPTTNSGPSNGETTMTTLSQKKAAQADNILGRLDRIAQVVQENSASWGMPFDEAKALVNTIDKLADDTEAFIYGEDSLRVRQAETLIKDPTFAKAARADLGNRLFDRAAAVLQRDSDEPYMDTFNSPTKPIQTDADEPYMDAYEDDQTVAVAEGEDATGRELAPGA